MKHYKLIFCDLDGTLLNSKIEISDFNKKIIGKICQTADTKFIMCSGRAYESIKYLQQKYQIEGPIVSLGGSRIFAEGKELFSNSISLSLIQELINFISPLNIETFIFASDGWYINKINSWYNFEVSKSLVQGKEHNFNDIVPYFRKNNIKGFKLLCMDKDIDKVNSIVSKLTKKFSNSLDIYKSQEWNIEIMPKAVDKGTAVDLLCSYYQVKATEVLAFGDFDNDISMLKTAGYSVAPANAQPSVKAIVDFIGPSNEEDCVGKVLDQLLKSENK